VAQRERLYPGSDVTCGELKSRVESPPSVATLAVEPDSIGPTRAVLKGRVRANGLVTTCHFEWGPDASYGSQSAPVDAGADFVDRVFEHEVAGLVPETAYHYRIVAESLWGKIRGGDRELTTDPAP
jgi:hypothetical protein